MKVPLSVGIVSGGLCHRHTHCAGANWALKQALTLVLLGLSLVDCEHIVAELAIEIVDLLLQAKSAQPLRALDAQIHLLEDKLAAEPALVVHEWGPELGYPPHLFEYLF